MNNDKIIKEYQIEEEKSIEGDLELRASQLRQIIDAVAGLKRNQHYKKYKELVLDDTLRVMQVKLLNERNHDNLMRFQGEASAIRKLAELDPIEKMYRGQLDKIEGRLLEIKNQNHE